MLITSDYNAANQLQESLLAGEKNSAEIDEGWNKRGQLANLTEYVPALGEESVKVISTYTYDGAGRMSNQQDSQQQTGDKFTSNITYQYDAAGRVVDILSRLDQYGGFYRYDNLNQVTSELHSTLAASHSYTYDAAGNRTDHGGQVNKTHVVQDAQFRYVAYDGEGNVLGKVSLDRLGTMPNGRRGPAEMWQYAYDQANETIGTRGYTSNASPGVTLINWEKDYYDALGNRIKVVTDARQFQFPGNRVGTPVVTKQEYLYSGKVVVAEKKTVKLDVTLNFYLNDASGQQLARVSPREEDDGDKEVIDTFFYVKDRQGSVLRVLAGNGDRAQTQILSYDAFGKPQIQGNQSSAPWYGRDEYGYTGQPFDALTGLQYNQDRYYDPRAHRWLQEDPLGLGGGDANPYRYAFNDPTNLADKNGAFVFTLGGALIGGLVGGFGSMIVSGQWDWDHFAAGAAAGALVGAGIGLTIDTGGAAGVIIGGALLGAGMGGASGSGAFQAGGKVSWDGFTVGAAVGGLAGAVGGGVGVGAGAAFGTSLLGMTAAGAVSGLAGNATSQLAMMGLGLQDQFNVTQFAFAGLGGAAGGFASGALTRGLAQQGLCNVSRGQWLTRTAIGGGLGGLLGDAADQTAGLLTGQQKSWDFGRTFQATALGVGQGLAAGYGQWRYDQVCFAAGMPLLTPEGSKPIEQFEVGDLVLSRSEFDPDGPVEAKVVLEKFVRVGRIMPLSLRGRVIGTTREHPFYPHGRGWTAAGELRVGERLRGKDDWVTLEGMEDSGQWQTVYNLRVADYHTYFVGCQEWGWSVWAHNVYGARSRQEIEAIGEDVRGKAEAALQAIQKAHAEGRTSVEFEGQTLRVSAEKIPVAEGGRGPALAVVKDTKTGRYFIAQNEDALPQTLHPIMQDRLDAYAREFPQFQRNLPDRGVPGRHAEFHALNEALLARGTNGPIEMSDFAMYVIRSESRTNAPVGSAFDRCGNCRILTHGVMSFSDNLPI